MKRIYTTLLYTLVAFVLLLAVLPAVQAQTPTAFNYQAVLRNSDGSLKISESLSMTLNLHGGSATGAVLYTETHETATDEFGIVNLAVGSLDPTAFEALDWAGTSFFVELVVDGSPLGTTQLLAVPYALYAINGNPGPEGSQGEAGPKGDTGSEGPEGPQGEVGPQGEAGPKGDTGSEGPEGPQGDKGDKGDTGAQGPEGPQGPAGVIGNNTVGSAHVIDNSLMANDLAPNSVGASELAANSVNGGDIVNATISNVDIAAAAGIATSKIFGDAGIEYTGEGTLKSWAVGAYGVQYSTKITMTIPASGYVLVIHTGSCVIGDDRRKLSLGVGTSSTAQTFGVSGGRLDGSKSDRFYVPYTTTGVFSVKARSIQTFYATGWGTSVFAIGNANFRTSSLVGIFIPKRY